MTITHTHTVILGMLQYFRNLPCLSTKSISPSSVPPEAKQHSVCWMQKPPLGLNDCGIYGVCCLFPHIRLFVSCSPEEELCVVCSADSEMRLRTLMT